MIQAYKLSLNTGNVMNAIRQHFIRAMSEAEDKQLDIMEREVMRTVHGNGPGKPAWREETREKLEVIEQTIADDVIESKVGFDRKGLFTSFVKAMIVSEGAGSAAGNAAIYAGPPGRMVWDNDMSSKHPSTAKSTYNLPAGFNQEGNQFVSNAIRLMEKHYDNIIATAWASLPESIFYGNVSVSAR